MNYWVMRIAGLDLNCVEIEFHTDTVFGTCVEKGFSTESVESTPEHLFFNPNGNFCDFIKIYYYYFAVREEVWTRLRNCLSIENGFEVIDIGIEGYKGINVLRQDDCLDIDRSDISYGGSKISYVDKIVLSRSDCPTIFRVEGVVNSIVSDAFVSEIIGQKITGVFFHSLDNWMWGSGPSAISGLPIINDPKKGIQKKSNDVKSLEIRERCDSKSIEAAISTEVIIPIDIPVTMSDCLPEFSPKELQFVEKQLGTKIPEQYLSFLRQKNGGLPAPGSFYANEHLDCIDNFLGISTTTDEGFLSELQFCKNLLQQKLLPVATNGAGDFVCLSIEGQNHSTYLWFHEMDTGGYTTIGELLKDEVIVRLAPNFQSFLDGLIEWPH